LTTCPNCQNELTGLFLCADCDTKAGIALGRLASFGAEWTWRPRWQKPKKDHTCWDCLRAIPRYHNMAGNGYQSASYQYADGEPVLRELCRECYLEDYAATFPQANLPKI
jgi:hypothetical protein